MEQRVNNNTPGTSTATIVEVTNNCYNSNVSDNGDFFDPILTIDAASGWTFDGVPTVTFTNSSGNRITKPFVMQGDAKGTFSAEGDMDTYKPVEVNGNTVSDTPEPKDIPVTTDLTQCSSDAPASVKDNAVLSVILTPASGYYFEATPTAKVTHGTETVIEAVMQSDGTAIVTVNMAEYPDSTAVTVTGVAVVKPAKTYPVTDKTEHCNAVGIPARATATDTLNITLSAASGYDFTDVTPKVLVNNTEGDILATGEFVFNVSADKKTATVTADLSEVDFVETSYIDVVGSAVPATQYGDKYGVCDVYVVTTDNLKAFAEIRFTETSGIDLGDYVPAIFRAHYNVGERKATTLKVGGKDLNIPVFTPDNDVLVLDFGSVELPRHNNDITDLKTVYDVFLPFVGVRQIPSEMVGRTVSLLYRVNTVTGEGVAVLSDNGMQFMVENCRPTSRLIYKLNTYQVSGDLEFNSAVLYGLQPYVRVTWYQSQNHNIANRDNNMAVISTFKGYTKFAEVTGVNAQGMTKAEYDEVLRFLTAGVYVY